MAEAANPVTNPLGALQQMAAAPMNQLMQQQQTDWKQRQDQLGALKAAMAPNEDVESAERWGAMATAAGQMPPLTGGFGAMIANIGGAYGKTLAEQRQREIQNQAMLTKLIDSGSLGAGSMTAMTQAALNPYVNVPGVGLVRRTDAALTLPSNMVPEYNKLYKGFYDQAVEQKMPNPEEWARQMAERQLGSAMGSREIAGGRSTPFGRTAVDTEGQPSVAGSLPKTAEPTAATGEFGVQLKTGTDTAALVKQLKQNEDKAVANQDFARARELQALRQRVEAGSYTETPGALEYKDVPKSKMEESQAGEVGKALAKEATTLNDAMSASNKMINQLNTLEKIYQTPNMPEGELGKHIQTLRSTLASLGVNVGKEVGAADMANAIASNFALHLRTGEGENLLPGQMSNYEDQLLQKMAPILSLTQEGRMALITYMREMAKANARMGHEVNLMTDERGIVSPEWRKRKERVMKEEMARLTHMSNELMTKFQGAK